MENLQELLNDKQYEAVTSTSKYLRIIAGAGSGKTTVLVNRIAYLIKYGNAYFLLQDFCVQCRIS